MSESTINPYKSSHPVKANHEYFKYLDAPRQAYWLGLLSADGQVQHNKHQSKMMRLDLITEDKYLIDALCIDLGCDLSRVKVYKRERPNLDVSRLVVPSDNLCNDLSKFGIVPRKTHTLTWPKFLKKKFYSHYIRGYFDGDGSIGLDGHIKICGTENFLIEMQSVLIEKCNLNKTKLQTRHKDRNNNIRSLEYGGRQQAIRIANYMYRDADIYMVRKKLRFDDLIKR